MCVTGGEPLLRPELEELLSQIKELGFPVKLDTNGSHPDRLRRLTEAGLVDYVAMDVKQPGRVWGRRRGGPAWTWLPSRESVSFLLSGAVDYEFPHHRGAGSSHDGGQLRAIGPWLAGARRYYLQSFVDRDTVLGRGSIPGTGRAWRHLPELMRPWVERCSCGGVIWDQRLRGGAP